MTFIQLRPDRPGAHPTAHQSIWGSFLRVKRPGIDFQPSPLSMSRMRLRGAMPLLPICAFKAGMGYIYLYFLQRC